jgi:Fic family protein
MSQFLDSENMGTGKQWSPDRPWNDLPVLPPRGDVETKVVLKRCVEARAALAGLRQSVLALPNPGILLDTLPALEAKSSSEIENIVTTEDSLYRTDRAEDAADPATAEALRYRDALLEGLKSLERRPVCVVTAEAVCSRIKGIDFRVRGVPGTRLASRPEGTVIYTPPDPGPRLAELLSNWERFLHESPALDPLVAMAIGHYQFEAIHPFTDGNGRTGRVLNLLYLMQRELLPSPVLPLSRFLQARKAEYYRYLLAVTRDAAWEEWSCFFLSVVEEAARWTTAKIHAVQDLRAQTAEYVRSARPKIYSGELVDLLFRRPYCRIGHLVEAGIAARQAASRYLKALTEIGVLREDRPGRQKLFVHGKLLILLTRERNDFSPYA